MGKKKSVGAEKENRQRSCKYLARALGKNNKGTSELQLLYELLPLFEMKKY